MERTCIICGEMCKEKVCVGIKKGMQAVFCDEHSGYCEDCDSVECYVID